MSTSFEHALKFATSMGLRLPVFQAPAGSIAGSGLVAAVSNSGGLGALALTWTPPDEARQIIRQVQAQTGLPFQGNFVLAFEAQSLLATLEAGVRIITFSWGLPVREAALVKSFGARLGIQATSIEGARRALELEPDFLICQGVEAGGHVQATRSLWETLPEIVAAAQGVPVVAAGGIGNGRAIARALFLGASAAMLGTRFVATQESLAHADYKRRLVDSGARDTALTVCFDGGWPQAAHRVLRNSTYDEWEAAGCPPNGKRPGEGDHVATAGGRSFIRYEDTPPREAMTGDVEAMCLYAGTSCEEVADVPAVDELMRRLWEECALAK